MLATIAALQLAVLSQVAPPPREITAADAAAEAAVPPAAGSPPQAGPAAPPRPRQLSLLSAEPLGGGSTALAWAGWSSLGIQYGQGITERDDLGALADFDWATSELRLGAFYRRPLGRAGDLDMAGRLSVAWYLNFGADWIHEENHSDRGIEVVPGLTFSHRAAAGILSAIAEAPLVVTTRQGAGLLFLPRFSLAYEAPLYADVTVGARLGAGYRAGSGDAPLKEGSAELLFLVVASYQLL
jgi:hypothetical protein